MIERTDDERPWSATPVRDGEPITGSCDHCEWYAVADSYAVMVKRYQDHLRDAHPDAWLRA